jgi:cyclase
MSHFYQTFTEANVDGALAASVFHSAEINIGELKLFLAEKKLSIRI